MDNVRAGGRQPLKAALHRDQGYTAIAMLNALPNPVLLVAGDGRIMHVNHAAEPFFATGAVHLCQMRLAEVLPFGSPLLDLVSQVRESAVSMSEYDLDVGTPKAGARTVNATVSPIADLPGSVLLFLQETSIANKMDRQLLYRGAARSVAGMAAILAHEVKNPLSGIRGAAQLLEQGAEGGDRELTRLICDEADRIVALVDRMEMFSDKPIERAGVNIHEVLERARRVAENGFARHVRFLERYDPSLPHAHGNFDQLVQVFLNLVKNAAEAVPDPGGEIAVSTGYRHGIRVAVKGSRERLRLPLEVIVSDNGPGIPEDIRPYLFDPFVTTKRTGSGLGLALVAKIIGDHGGIVEFESLPRRTLFRVLLPIHEEAAG